jgi:hypothetical protein
MEIFMTIKNLFLYALSFYGLAHADSAKLVKIVNTSSESVLFKYAETNFTIKAGDNKKLFVEIPFTSRQKNLMDFIQDRPYVPTDALEIVTQEGTFYMWRDERGIIVAKAFVRGMSRSEALPAVFLSLSPEELNRVIGCIVTINNTGLLSIKKS